MNPRTFPFGPRYPWPCPVCGDETPNHLVDDCWLLKKLEKLGRR
jgi:hypothetical protein